MMFDRLNPVASANVTIGLILSGIHCINLLASSLVSQRMRLLNGLLVFIDGQVSIHRQSLVAVLSNDLIKDRYWLLVAKLTCFGVYFGGSTPFFIAASFFISHICRCFLFSMQETDSYISSAVMLDIALPENFVKKYSIFVLSSSKVFLFSFSLIHLIQHSSNVR
ncbi:Uncharacterised protein [Proteus mirabilis]|nr:Uncharacterised protein [Proteus mirabilis]